MIDFIIICSYNLVHSFLKVTFTKRLYENYWVTEGAESYISFHTTFSLDPPLESKTKTQYPPPNIKSNNIVLENILSKLQLLSYSYCGCWRI